MWTPIKRNRNLLHPKASLQKHREPANHVAYNDLNYPAADHEEYAFHAWAYHGQIPVVLQRDTKNELIELAI